ncbi:hypothetical protein JTG27_001645 [Escherichia coli]|nr:hypothetical protein [Escherichia coli]EHC4149277.1 hypothetical protein [Escherichia coli]
MPGRFELKPTLEKVWHAPDNFRFMDPLPPMHRRGIIIAAIVLVVGFLLPSDDTPNAPVVTGLTIDTGNNQQVLFTRQPDGSFIRAR